MFRWNRLSIFPPFQPSWVPMGNSERYIYTGSPLKIDEFEYWNRPWRAIPRDSESELQDMRGSRLWRLCGIRGGLKVLRFGLEQKIRFSENWYSVWPIGWGFEIVGASSGWVDQCTLHMPESVGLNPALHPFLVHLITCPIVIERRQWHSCSYDVIPYSDTWKAYHIQKILKDNFGSDKSWFWRYLQFIAKLENIY